MYIRLSLMKAKVGREQDVNLLTGQLVDFYRQQAGFVDGYTLRAADETGDVGRINIWTSEEAADHVAQNNHVLALRADLIPMLEDRSDVERSFWAEAIAK